MPRRLAALLLDLLLLQLLLLGGSGECITRDHAPLTAAVAVADPHAAHAAHAAHGSHGTAAGVDAHGAPTEDGADPAGDGGAHCMMAVSCAATSLAAHVPAMHGMPPVHAAAIAPRVALPASPAFSPEPPPPRA